MKRLATATLVCLITGCSIGGWVAGTVYNGLHKRLWSDVEDFAAFDTRQEAWIRASIRSFHDWHRQRELPRYATWMQLLEQTLSDGNPDAGQLEAWTDQLQNFTGQLNYCNPLRQTTELLTTLDDAQAGQFVETLEAMRQESAEDVTAVADDNRESERFKDYRRYLKRVGLKLDDAQQELLKQTLARRHLTREPGLALWASWNQEFSRLLQQRHEPGFNVAMQAHLDGLGSLSERHMPEAMAHNRQLWQDFFLRLFASQSDKQRQQFLNTLRRYRQIVEQLAQDPGHGLEPDSPYQPAAGCEPVLSAKVSTS